MLLVIDFNSEDLIVDVLNDKRELQDKEKSTDNLPEQRDREIQKQIIDIHGNIVSV